MLSSTVSTSNALVSLILGIWLGLFHGPDDKGFLNACGNCRDRIGLSVATGLPNCCVYRENEYEQIIVLAIVTWAFSVDTIAFVSNNTLLICSGYQVIKSLKSAKEPGKIFRSQRKNSSVLRESEQCWTQGSLKKCPTGQWPNAETGWEGRLPFFGGGGSWHSRQNLGSHMW